METNAVANDYIFPHIFPVYVPSARESNKLAADNRVSSGRISVPTAKRSFRVESRALVSATSLHELLRLI